MERSRERKRGNDAARDVTNIPLMRIVNSGRIIELSGGYMWVPVGGDLVIVSAPVSLNCTVLLLLSGLHVGHDNSVYHFSFTIRVERTKGYHAGVKKAEIGRSHLQSGYYMTKP